MRGIGEKTDSLTFPFPSKIACLSVLGARHYKVMHYCNQITFVFNAVMLGITVANFSNQSHYSYWSNICLVTCVTWSSSTTLFSQLCCWLYCIKEHKTKILCLSFVLIRIRICAHVGICKVWLNVVNWQWSDRWWWWWYGDVMQNNVTSSIIYYFQ